jgi:hypothetical protein
MGVLSWHFGKFFLTFLGLLPSLSLSLSSLRLRPCQIESILVHCIKSLSFVPIGSLQASVIGLLLVEVVASNMA